MPIFSGIVHPLDAPAFGASLFCLDRDSSRRSQAFEGRFCLISRDISHLFSFFRTTFDLLFFYAYGYSYPQKSGASNLLYAPIKRSSSRREPYPEPTKGYLRDPDCIRGSYIRADTMRESCAMLSRALQVAVRFDAYAWCGTEPCR